jgi:hypothetical protein
MKFSTAYALLQARKKRRRDEMDDDDRLFSNTLQQMQQRKRHCANWNDRNGQSGSLPTTSSQTSAKSGMMYVIDRESGKLRHGIPHDSLWWVNYVLTPPGDLTQRQRFKFRRRFRMPIDEWIIFVEKLNSNPLFKPWKIGNTDVCGRQCSPIALLSLGALKYLGRKCTFDDLEESTFISERTHERFFEKFVEFGSTSLFHEYVIMPRTVEEMESHMHEMKLAGMDGGGASTDATNVTIENCRYGSRQPHLGPKGSKTSRTYNASVTHRHRILNTTAGHPSRWNDKTLILFDDFATGLKDGSLLGDYEFFLYERDVNGDIQKFLYHGIWLLVDNGYLDWSVTIPPYKYCTRLSEIRWSQWLESMRKDVECTFGILKKRWTILSKGVQARKLECADQVWKTCCALHNMLLEIDGFDEMWQGSIPNTAHGEGNTCFALQRLNSPDLESFTVFRPTEGLLPSSGPVVELPTLVNNLSAPRIVRNMGQDEFRQKLVEHFDILFWQNKIVWPKRVKTPRSV